jgi:Raf kinase inhibitor-like YbhB/YbcL family protein
MRRKVFTITGLFGIFRPMKQLRKTANRVWWAETVFGIIEYGGPCPPSGSHRYFFKVYALDSELDVETGADKQKLENAMKGHVLASGELMAHYQKRR